MAVHFETQYSWQPLFTILELLSSGRKPPTRESVMSITGARGFFLATVFVSQIVAPIAAQESTAPWPTNDWAISSPEALLESVEP